MDDPPEEPTVSVMYGDVQARLMRINSPRARRSIGWLLIQHDLDWCIKISEMACQQEERVATDLDKMLFLAFAVTYGKCFTQARGRRVKLDAAFVQEESMDIHSWIMDVRHNFVAHAGPTEREGGDLFVAIHPDNSIGRVLGMHPRIHSFVSVGREDWHAFRDLAANLKARVDERVGELMAAMENWASQQPIDSLYSGQIEED